MYNRLMYLSLICLVLFSGCFFRKDDSASEKLLKLGITARIPKNFKELPYENFIDLVQPTLIEAEPFAVNPVYAYAEESGKGIIIVSELKFTEGFVPEKFPMNNIYLYKKNLEAYFGVDEISSEDIYGKDISTLLLAMVYDNDGEALFLFKGLSYIYPDRFFMIDLYVNNNDITESEAFEFVEMYNSLGIL